MSACPSYTEANLKFLKLNPQAQQREAVVQGQSLSPYRLRYKINSQVAEICCTRSVAETYCR
ncbi:MAG: hypothetical protein LBJ00_06765 [Planctomycetaceae bacterium]|nr:hypothetical protein [Planctomycetaceae bacterium]